MSAILNAEARSFILVARPRWGSKHLGYLLQIDPAELHPLIPTG